MDSCAECGEPISREDDDACGFCGTRTPWASDPAAAGGDEWSRTGAYDESRPTPSRRNAPLLSGADLLRGARDGLIVLGTALILSAASVAALGSLLGPGHAGGPRDWLVGGLLLVAGSLGAPARIAYTITIPDFGGASTPLTVADTTKLHAVVWLLTLTILFLAAFLSRRGEARAPSATAARLLARAAVPALVVTAALYALSLVLTATNLFGLLSATQGPVASLLMTAAGSSGGTPSLSAHIGVAAGWLLLGPPLALLAASCAGRLGARVHRNPGGAVARLIDPWRGAAASVWLQLRCVGLLSALVGVVYALDRVSAETSWSGGAKTAAFAGAVLLAGNFAVAGTLLGFGASVGVAVTTGVGIGGAAQGIARDYGLFGVRHPAGLFALLAAALIGSALPALWLPGRARKGVPAPGFAPSGVWRAALLGALFALAAGLLGQVGVNLDLGLAGRGGVSVRAGLLGAVVACAVWCAAAYLGLALRARRGASQQSVAVPEQTPEAVRL